MGYASLMVHLELGRSNAGLLQIAGDLAQRFHAHVIGIAACQPLQMIYGDGCVSADVYQADRDEVTKEIKTAEAEFRAVLQAQADTLEWHSTERYEYLADYLARQARSADLILTGMATGDLFDSSRMVNTSDLIMRAGRPVLIVPTTATALKLKRVLVGWKDTRETRRAVSDALPLLQQAEHVSVVQVTAEENLPVVREHLDEVVAWMKRHDIEARASALPSTGDDAAALSRAAEAQRSDVIVAGAYGHSRLREWVLGGVTRDLLLSPNRCAFVSH